VKPTDTKPFDIQSALQNSFKFSSSTDLSIPKSLRSSPAQPAPPLSPPNQLRPSSPIPNDSVEKGIVRVFLAHHSFLTPLGLGKCHKSIYITNRTTGSELHQRILWKMLRSIIDGQIRQRVEGILVTYVVYGYEGEDEWQLAENENVWKFEQNVCGVKRKLVFRKKTKKYFGF
jgi:hypothetical protein